MIDATTPLMQQYQSIKSRYPHALLLFRLGDFYELFYEDAILASRELQITLTSRNREKGQPIPMCGDPVSLRRRLHRAPHSLRLQSSHLRSDGASRSRQEISSPRSRSRHHPRHRHRRRRPRRQRKQFPGLGFSRHRDEHHRPRFCRSLYRRISVHGVIRPAFRGGASRRTATSPSAGNASASTRATF